MQILSASEILVLSELLLEDMPRAILQIISYSPGISEGEIIGSIKKKLPMTVDSDHARERCITSIRWFLHNGDITSSGNRRYVALPPYSVLLPDGNDNDLIKICGNRILDDEINKMISSLDLRLDIEMVPWSWMESKTASVPRIGIKRSIYHKSKKTNSVLKKLKSLGISIVEPVDISNKLPTIDSVFNPSKSLYNVHPPNWGFWDVYNPRIDTDDRWNQVDNLQDTEFSLLRWQSSRDWRGKHYARFFNHSGGEELAELGQLSGRLMMFYLDRQEGNPRRMWLDEKVIWLPIEIPDYHQYWLQLLSKGWYRHGSLRQYDLNQEPKGVIRKLEETLGLNTISSRPE